MKAATVALIGLALASAPAGAQSAQLPPEQVARGAQLFALNCATCHGTRMRNPQWAIDLHTFPRDAKARFIDSVTNGKSSMPSWDDVLTPGGPSFVPWVPCAWVASILRRALSKRFGSP